jgi:two-component system CheB/CheR fusion protein
MPDRQTHDTTGRTAPDAAPRPRAGGEEAAFVAFQNITPDGFMMFRPVRSNGGTIVDLEWAFVNAAAGRIVDRMPEDLVGKRLLVEMPANKQAGLFDAYVGVIETGETWQQEFFYDHGGITAWFRTTAVKAGDGLALSFADISEIRKGDERLRNLIDSVLAFVGVLSLDGTLLEANEPAVAAAGVDRDALIGQPFWDCYWWSFDAATQARLQQAVETAAGGKRVRYDAEIRISGDRRI